MQRWAALNERQLAVLKRIGAGTEQVTSRDSELANTVYALRGRGLVTTPRRSGGWHAEITEAGTFYLEHGHHPDRPPHKQATPSARGTAEGEPRKPAGSKDSPVRTAIPEPRTAPLEPPKEIPRPTRSEITAEELITQIRNAGGTLRVENPGDDLRAAYRRAIDAAKRQKAVPTGHHLRFTGRRNGSGDLVVQLADDRDPDETSWNRERLKRSRTLTDVDGIIAAVEKDPVRLEVSAEALPRALAILRAVAEEALSRGHGFSINKKRRHPNPRLQVDGLSWELAFKEEQEKKPHVPTPQELRQRKVYNWQRVTPKYDSVPSGRLILEARRESHGSSPTQWSDTKRRTLEQQLRTIVKELEGKAVEALEAQRVWEVEHRRRLEELEREKAEQRARWETAMQEARGKAREAQREQDFRDGLERWHVCQDIRAFCGALEESAVTTQDPEQVERLRQWIRWGRDLAERIDPTRGASCLGTTEFDMDPQPDALRPYLGKWSPHRPEEEYRYASSPQAQQPVTASPLDQGWRYGHPGRAQWWRR